MSENLILALIIAVVILVIVLVFREQISIKLKALGFNLDVQASNPKQQGNAPEEKSLVPDTGRPIPPAAPVQDVNIERARAEEGNIGGRAWDGSVTMKDVHAKKDISAEAGRPSENSPKS